MVVDHDSKTVDAPAEVDPLVGCVVDGRLKLERRIGAGGMGSVYAARQIDGTDRLVAVKFIRPELITHEESERRFWREIRTMAAQTHPHVVTVFFAGRATVAEAQVPYYAMELLGGKPLSRWCGNGRCMSLPIAVRVAVRIAQGLEFLHKQGIVHRDLKPANVQLLDDLGEQVKLMDFGLARQAVQDEARLTATDVVMGTPGYMSPEQLMGQDIDGRSDLYSLGATLHVMVFGRLPERASSGSVEDPRTYFSRLDVPPALSALIVELLEMNPGARPQSASEVIRLLQLVGAQLDTSDMGSQETEQFGGGKLQTPARPGPQSGKRVVPPDALAETAFSGLASEQGAASASTGLSRFRSSMRRQWLMPAFAVAGILVAAVVAWKWNDLAGSSATQAGAPVLQGDAPAGAGSNVSATPDSQAVASPALAQEEPDVVQTPVAEEAAISPVEPDARAVGRPGVDAATGEPSPSSGAAIAHGGEGAAAPATVADATPQTEAVDVATQPKVAAPPGEEGRRPKEHVADKAPADHKNQERPDKGEKATPKVKEPDVTPAVAGKTDGAVSTPPSGDTAGKTPAPDKPAEVVQPVTKPQGGTASPPDTPKPPVKDKESSVLED